MDTLNQSSKHSLRRFILLWMGGLAVCYVVLTGVLIWSTSRLQLMSDRIFTDSNALETSRQLEATILSERREALLWRATGVQSHYDKKFLEIKEAERLIVELGKFVTTKEESLLIEVVHKRFGKYIEASTSKPPIPVEEVTPIADSLLEAVDKFRRQNRQQMVQTLEESNALNITVDRLSEIFVVLSVLVIAAGSYILIRRILLPITGLSHAAATFGKGDFSARAPVYRDDELGMLCEQLNIMAEDISMLEKERLNLVASIAHDLKNPLMVIGGAARRLKRKFPFKEDDVIWLDRIANQAVHLENLILDLIDAFRIETGELKLKMKDFSMVSMLRNIQQINEKLHPTHKVVLEAESDFHVTGDPDRLERVITNLMSNAIKYSPPGSTVVMQAMRYSPVEVAVLVKDEGVGIPSDEMNKLFQPFNRLSQTEDMARGTGLGLFSSLKIIESHGGRIDVSSVAGQGTTVKIVLPGTEGEATNTPGESDGSNSPGQREETQNEIRN